MYMHYNSHVNELKFRNLTTSGNKVELIKLCKFINITEKKVFVLQAETYQSLFICRICK